MSRMKQRSPKKRCAWAESHELLRSYHDAEWGVPVHDDRLLFEMLNLEGAQAGLSWLTVLKKREAYRQAFANFDAAKMARFGLKEKKKLLENEGIVRNRAKVDAFIANAKAFLEARHEFGCFDEFVWSFSEGQILQRNQRPRALLISEVMSKTLRKRGFKFVGPTICFAFMQAIGMIDDHDPGCFRSGKKPGRSGTRRRSRAAS